MTTTTADQHSPVGLVACLGLYFLLVPGAGVKCMTGCCVCLSV